MHLFRNIFSKIKTFIKPAVMYYPLIIIVSIPLLIAANTIWNLRSFNRDTNHIIRQQAVRIAETLKPVILENIGDEEKLSNLQKMIEEVNHDIISSAVLVVKGKNIEILSSTADAEEASKSANLPLNQLAAGFYQPIAGLTYDSAIKGNVWNVVVPLDSDENTTYLLALKIQTGVVEEILNRTSRDSIFILVITIIITLILLANHFIFYQKMLKAKQLEELDRLKDEFISTAAHELRSPMTALSGRLMLLDKKIPEAVKEKVSVEIEVINRVSKNILNLINDLLDVSRIEQGRLQIKKEEVSVNEEISKVIELIVPLAEQKGLEIKYEQTDLPKIQTDPERLRQVVTNLLSNSVKYTLKGRIEIKTEKDGQYISITVSDTGVGIPPDHLPKLFSKFHRVKDSQTEGQTGTGLGLWITKQIVEMLGGNIYAESIYGTGTRFTFTLPLS